MNRPSPQAHQEFLQNYHRYVLETVNPVRLRLRALLDEWRAPTYWEAHRTPPLPIPSPVLSGVVRVKRPEAVVDKILRNPEEFPAGLAMESVLGMGDVLGGRIVVSFLPDVGLVDREIQARRDLVLWGKKRPRTYLEARDAELAELSFEGFEQVPRDWNSAALVYWLCFDSEAADARPFQLQVVTLVQSAWADAQRQLGYHPKRETEQQVVKRFRELGLELRGVEHRLAALRHELAEYQQAPHVEPEGLLNAENLPALLSDTGVSCAQIELEGMLKVLASHGVETVSDLRQRATKEVVDSIRQTYVEEVGWAPYSFEVVSTLALLGPLPASEEVIRAARLNQQYLAQWDTTVRESSTARDDRTPFSPKRATLARLRGGD